MKKVLFTALALVMSIGLIQAQTADEIAKNYIEAIGGEAKWRSLKNTKMTINFNQQGTDLTGYLIEASDGRNLFQLELQGMKMIQAYDGTTPWGMNQFVGEMSPKKLEGPAALIVENTDFLDEFMILEKKKFTIALDGEVDFDGKPSHRIKLTRSGGKVVMYFFDKETHLKIGEEADGQVTIYTDYKEVDGVTVPMKIIQKAGENVIFTITVTKAEVDADLSDDPFAYPGN